MATVSLPKTNQTGTNEWADVQDNDDAIIDQVNGNLDSDNLASNAVTTAKITDANVTTAKLAASAVTTAKIADANVTTAKIADANVTGAKLFGGITAVEYAEVLTEETTASTSATDLTTAGPSVTVTVPTNGLVAVMAEAEMKNSDPDESRVLLHEATDLSTAGQIIVNVSSTFAVGWTGGGSGGTGALQLAGFNTFPASAGTLTYKLQYSVNAGTGTFKNRKLWVAVIGGF